MKTTLQPQADKLVKFYSGAQKTPFVRLARNATGGIILDAKGMPLVEIFAEAAVKEIVEGENSVVHFISTPRIDPVKDVMNPFGANTRRLDKNRGVFYNHRWSGAQDLPIGKNLWTKPVRDGLLAKTQYAVDERTDGFAKCIFKMVQGGFLNSYSIGFFPSSYSFVAVSDLLKLVDGQFDVPNASEYSADDQICYHKEWNMYEYSQVGVPMNEDAVRKAAEKGLAIAEEIGSEYGVDFFGKMNGGRQKIDATMPAKTPPEIEAEVVPDEIEGEEKGVIRFAHHPLAPAGTAWSAGAEVKKAGVKELKVMCTWFAEPGDKKGDYKLPHHKGDGDHPTVWNGVKAAMGALLGARGGVQIPASAKGGCHAHLASHYKEFEKPVPEMKEYSEEELKAMFPENYETKQVEPGEEDVSARFDDVDSELAALSQAVAGLAEATNGLNAKLDQCVSLLEAISEEEQSEPAEGAGPMGGQKKLKGAAESSGATAPAQTDLAELRRQAIAGELSRKTGRS